MRLPRRQRQFRGDFPDTVGKIREGRNLPGSVERICNADDFADTVGEIDWRKIADSVCNISCRAQRRGVNRKTISVLKHYKEPSARQFLVQRVTLLSETAET